MAQDIPQSIKVDSPYAPPAAELQDVAQAQHHARPVSVGRGIRWLWFNACASSAIAIWGGLEPTLFNLGQDADTSGFLKFWAMQLGYIAFVLIGTAGMLYFVGRGHNWARILILIFTCVSLAFLPSYFEEFRVGAINGLRLLAHLFAYACSVYGCVQLLTRSSRVWFKEMRAR